MERRLYAAIGRGKLAAIDELPTAPIAIVVDFVDLRVRPAIDFNGELVATVSAVLTVGRC